MKILTYSDLHFELNTTKPFVLPEDIDGDIMILAGDILNFDDPIQLDNLVEFLKPWGTKPVLYVAGNHEYYTRTKCDMAQLQKRFRKFCHTTNLGRMTFLEGDNIDNDDRAYGEHIVRSGEYEEINFFGGTMWTDLLDGTNHLGAKLKMNDYDYIKHDGRLLDPADTMAFHEKYLIELETWLQFIDRFPPNFSKRVVISHHCPIPEESNGRGSAYFSTKTRAIIENPDNKIDLWIHGHTHKRQDYMVGNTRIISNPYGYDKRHYLVKDFDPYGSVVEL
jgi:predicted phosphodiesterase